MLLVRLLPFLIIQCSYAVVPRPKAVFIERGDLRLQTETAHLTTELPLREVIRRYNKLIERFPVFEFRTERRGSTEEIRLVHSVKRSLLTLERSVQLICEHLPCPEVQVLPSRSPRASNSTSPPPPPPPAPLKRQKRQLLLGLGILASVGLSLYSLADLRGLKQTIQDNQANVELLYHQVQVDQTLLTRQTAEILRLQKTLTAFGDSLTLIEREVHSLELLELISRYISGTDRWLTGLLATVTTKRFHPGLFPPEETSRALRVLGQEVQGKGLRLAVDLGNLPEMPLSYLVEEGVVHVFIHLPVVREEGYRLLEMLPVPFLPEDKEQGLCLLRAPEPYLYLNPQESEFRSISAADLATCTASGSRFLCASATLQRRPGGSCSLGLYFGEPHSSLDCSVSCGRWSELTVQVGTRTVLVARDTSVPTVGHLTCPGNPLREIELKGITEIEVPSGCSFTTPETVIHPKDQHHFTKPFLSKEIPDSISLPTPAPEPVYNFTLPLPDLPKLPPLQHHAALANNLASTIGMAAVAIAVLVTIIVFWRRYRKKRARKLAQERLAERLAYVASKDGL